MALVHDRGSQAGKSGENSQKARCGDAPQLLHALPRDVVGDVPGLRKR